VNQLFSLRYDLKVQKMVCLNGLMHIVAAHRTSDSLFSKSVHKVAGWA
jgi:hypothetical protein